MRLGATGTSNDLPLGDFVMIGIGGSGNTPALQGLRMFARFRSRLNIAQDSNKRSETLAISHQEMTSSMMSKAGSRRVS